MKSKIKTRDGDRTVGGCSLLLGDNLDRLDDIPDGYCHLCCTSPPYYALRSYEGTAQWVGGDADCDHRKVTPEQATRAIATSTLGPNKDGVSGQKTNSHQQEGWKGGVCKRCGAKRIDKQIGAEERPDCAGWATGRPCGKCFVCALVAVFRKVRRVLRNDGVCILNLGDSYNSGSNKPERTSRPGAGKVKGRQANRDGVAVSGLGPKNLLAIPWRVALALQTNGWTLRSAFPWISRSRMPESCIDRASNGLEYVFVLTKRPTGYYWDVDAVRQANKPYAVPVESARDGRTKMEHLGGKMSQTLYKAKGRAEVAALLNPDGRNWRNSDLWLESIKPPHGLMGMDDELVGLDVTTEALKADHYAAYPCKLVQPFISAATSQKGCCAKCGAPWRRVVEKERAATRPGRDSKVKDTAVFHGGIKGSGGNRNDDGRGTSLNAVVGNRDPERHCTTSRTVGWAPGCRCYGTEAPAEYPNTPKKDAPADEWSAYQKQTDKVRKHNADLVASCIGFETSPCVILDPFAGAFTTCLVAERMGRRSIGIELSEKYLLLGEKRIKRRGRVGREPDNSKGQDGSLGLFGG